jgi:putative membrane protein
MNNTTTIITRCTVGALGLAFVSLAGIASAQNPVSASARRPESGSGTTSAQSNTSAQTSGGKKGASLSAKDKRFINEAAKGGMMEVEGGKMAGQNAKHPDVKKFGNRMVADHTKANTELMAIASARGVQAPAMKSPGSWKNDKAYMDMMVKDHEKDLSEFQAEASGGSDPELKKFANKTSKIIEKHLQMAREIQGKLKS